MIKAAPIMALAGAAVLAGAVMVGAGTSPRLLTISRTSLDGRSPSQKHNTLLSARAIDGSIIAPGQVFSFNGAVGSWSRDKGFKRAPVSFNGSLIDAWGGGVCQTSTTLYGAALQAGLGIEERSPHRFAPGYVTPGRDAAVAFPNIDLKIRNTLDRPVEIKTFIRDNELVVELWGASAKKPVAVRTEIIRQIDPSTKTLGGSGWPRLRSPGKPGCEVRTLREMDGETLLVSHDYYPVMHRVVEWVKAVE